MKVIIVGAGQVGWYLASRLSAENQDVIVIDRNPDAASKLEALDVQVMTGSGSSPADLLEAGIQGADMIVAVTDSDEINIIACLIASSLNKPAAKIARIRNQDVSEFLDTIDKRFLNIDLIINPEEEVAKTVLRLLETPGASDVINLAEGQVKLIGLRVKARSNMAGRKLMALTETGLADHFLVAAISRGESLIIPRGQDKIMANDLVYLIIEPTMVDQVMSLFGAEPFELKRVMIIGGGSLGLTLARAVEQQGAAVKLIERDPARCSYLAAQLSKTTVLQGDGTDKDLLREESIDQVDAAIVVTGDEEENVLIALLSQQMGARQTITRISKMGYMPLVEAVGLERVVSPRLCAANAILQHIRRGKVMSVNQIKGETAEVIEVQALETSDLVGRPLAALKFPEDAIIGCIVRDDQMIVPKGDTEIAPGDRVVILAHRQAIPKVEKALTVKLDHF